MTNVFLSFVTRIYALVSTNKGQDGYLKLKLNLEVIFCNFQSISGLCNSNQRMPNIIRFEG